MIKNERQYLITKNQARKFKETIEVLRRTTADKHSVLVKAQRDALESQLRDLKSQIGEYEKLRSGKLTKLKKPHLRIFTLP